jgi:hypothetical protein
MQHEILPPESVPVVPTPRLQPRHLPLALLYLGGLSCALGLLIFGAVILEIAAALFVFLLLTALILLVVPTLFVAAYRRRS